MTDNRDFVHRKRLEIDYKSMQQLRGSLISWVSDQPSNSSTQFPSKYVVTYHMIAPTIEGDLRKHILDIDCSSVDYPLRYLPQVKFRTPVIKHPHIYSDGSRRICLGGFPLSEDLGKMCIRLARFFQYDLSLIDPRSIASREFYDWYLQNRNRLPLDHSQIPIMTDDSDGFRVIQKTAQSNSSAFKVTKRSG